MSNNHILYTVPGQNLQYNTVLNTNNGSLVSPALSITNDNGNPLLSFRKDGIIETSAGNISVEDWIVIITVMKQFIIDVAKDDEAVKKYPYLKDAAFQMLMNKLTD